MHDLGNDRCPCYDVFELRIDPELIEISEDTETQATNTFIIVLISIRIPTHGISLSMT